MTDKEYGKLMDRYETENGCMWRPGDGDADIVYNAVRSQNPILAEKLRRLINSEIGQTLLDGYEANTIIAFDLYDDRNVVFADAYRGGTTEEQDTQIQRLAGSLLRKMYYDLFGDSYGRAAMIINGACEDIYNGYPTDADEVQALEEKRRETPCDGNYGGKS